jgi:hypothetical protein
VSRLDDHIGGARRHSAAASAQADTGRREPGDGAGGGVGEGLQDRAVLEEPDGLMLDVAVPSR